MPDNLNVERRYPALSFIAITLKGVAFLVAGAGGLMAVLAFGSGGSGGSGGALMGTGMILATAVVFLIVWATAESISVLVDIEANTRAAALALQRPAQASGSILDRIEPS